VHIGDEVLDRVRAEGFAVVEGFLTSDELAAARAGVFEEFPTHDQYVAEPERHAHVVAHQFAGLRVGPFASWDLTRLALHPDLVDAAERFCGTSDLDLYKVELWAKYSGAVDYDQTHHRDFGNHDLLVPRADHRWPQLTTFILLSDVTEHDGPTKVVPRSVGDALPLWPSHVGSDIDRGLREQEVAVTGPGGSIFLYTTDVLHRGSAFTGHPRSRFALLADYTARGNPWQGKVSWPGRALDRAFQSVFTHASPRELNLFGVPLPGHEYWDDQTLRDVARRYPAMDMTPYRRT
jgi:hypothetical protein